MLGVNFLILFVRFDLNEQVLVAPGADLNPLQPKNNTSVYLLVSDHVTLFVIAI